PVLLDWTGTRTRKAPCPEAPYTVGMCHLCDATEARFISCASDFSCRRKSWSALFAARSACRKVRLVRRDSTSDRNHTFNSSGTTGQKMRRQTIASSPEQRRCRRQALLGQQRG